MEKARQLERRIYPDESGVPVAVSRCAMSSMSRISQEKSFTGFPRKTII